MLVVGPVTCDVLPDGRQPGGAVAYAARVAAVWGHHVRVLAAGVREDDLSRLGAHAVALVKASRELVFRHRPARAGRERVLDARGGLGRPLTADDLPGTWRDDIDVLMLAPLLPGDLHARSFYERCRPARVALLAQGMQRERQQCEGEGEGGDGWTALGVGPGPTAELREAVAGNVSVFLSEAECAPWREGEPARLAREAERVVVTRGVRGARVHHNTGVVDVPAVPAAAVIDTTGAGDVFASAYTLALDARSGRGPGSGADAEQRAGGVAAHVAAASLAYRGPAALPERAVRDALVAAGAERGAP